MTAPGAGQNINLAALWIPVMPDTAHMGEEMRKAGGEAKSQFEQGFNSSGSSPENIGQSFGSKLIASINKEMKGIELPLGTSNVFEKLNGEVDKSVEKLRGSASEALQKYRQEYDNLGAAQVRAAEAEQKVNAARENGANKASIMIPLIQEQTAAQTALKEAHVNTGVALDDYNGKLGKLSEAHREAGNSGSMMAGIMGGAVVAGVGLAIAAVDKLAEGVAEGFKMAIEISKELAEKTLELGETYEHIGIQIHEFSAASGEEFENMEKSAQRVFSTLDVAGADTGKTMAQLSSSMGVPAQSIESLVHNVTDLQGRFTSLKSQDLASVFVAFKTPAKDADSALASLLKSSRESGQDLGQLTQALSGMAGLTLKEAGLNLQQAGAFMADMLKHGEPGRQVMTGMSSAMKEFGKEGISFKDGMKITADTLKELGNTAEGQDLAEKLFGTRNWIVAKDAVDQYLQVVEKGPDAFNANADSLTQFLDQTETLGNKFEEFKHKAEDVFKPFGTAAQTLATQGLNNVSTWFTTHQPEILGDIKSWGDKMIDEIPTIQKFAEDGLRIFGDFSQVILAGLAPITLSLGVAGAGALALTGHFSDAKDLMIAAAKIPATPIADMANTMADKIAAMHVDTQGIRDDFDAAVNSALAMPPGIGGGVRGSAGFFSAGGPSAVAPGGSASATGSQSGSINPAFGDGHHVADWDAIAAKEGGGQWNITYTTGVPEGGGLQIKPDTWAQYGGLDIAPKPYQATKEQQEMIAERILNGWNGIAGQGPSAWDNGKTYVEKKASGGAPGSSMGRLVTAGRGSGDDVAALLKRGEYVWDTETMDKFGWLVTALHQGTTGFGQGGDVGGVSQVIWSDLEDPTVQAAGGDAGIGALYGKMASGGPGSAYSNETNANGQGFAGHHGHVHTTFNADPFTGEPYNQVPAGTNTAAGEWSAFPPWVKQLGDMYGLDAKTYAGHQEWDGANHGIDWWPRGKQDMSGQSYTHADNAMLTNFADAAIAVGTGQMQGFNGGYGPSTLAPTVGGPGSTPGGKNGGAYTGMAGQYGGLGAYGGETADQAYAAQQAVQEARDHQADLDWRVSQGQQKIDDLKAELAQGDPNANKPGLLPGTTYAETPAEQKAWADKQKSLNEQLSNATHELTVSQREQGEQGGKVTEALRKQQEAMYKKPSTQAGGNKDAQSLGSGLLAGIGEELGLGTVFTKSPLDWGIVKLAEGLFNYANGLGDAIFGQTNGGIAGGTPGGSQGLGGGLVNGLLGSVGIKAPTAMLSAGPNVVPGAPPGTPIGAAGTGGGPLPGPVYQDNSINISPNVDPSAILPPVIGMQRDQAASTNASSFTNTGGFPAP